MDRTEAISWGMPTSNLIIAGNSEVDHLVCKLHGCHNIQHVGGLTHLLFLQQVDVIQPGAADQDLDYPIENAFI